MTPQLLRKIIVELNRQVETNRLALGRLEYLGSEETGTCFITRQVRRAVKRGDKLLDELERKPKQ